MNILCAVIRRLNILDVSLVGDGTARLTLVRCVYSKGRFVVAENKPIAGIGSEAGSGTGSGVGSEAGSGVGSGKASLVGIPLCIVVSGRGVVTKDASAERVVAAVTSSPETFVWSISDGSISFLRREQLSPVVGALEAIGVRPLHIECAAPGDDEGAAGESIAARFASHYFRWRVVLRPSAEGSIVAMCMARRLMLPVLAVLLLVLVAGFAVSSRVNENFAAASTELAALRKTSSQAAVHNENRQAALERFARTPAFRASRLADRIAAATPPGVVLRELAIAPVLKSPETGKPVAQSEQTVIVVGETTDPEAVAGFIGALERSGLGAIRLAALQQDDRRGILTFRIEIMF